MTKKCTKCGKTKELSLFYKHKRGKYGKTSRCKECSKDDVATYREVNIIKVREYDRRRSGTPHRREQSNEYGRRLRKTDPDRIREYHARYKRKNPIKKAAHCILNNAVRNGRIERPLVCSKCEQSGKIEAHHSDYYRPLDVEWVCKECHTVIHKHKETK